MATVEEIKELVEDKAGIIPLKVFLADVNDCIREISREKKEQVVTEQLTTFATANKVNTASPMVGIKTIYVKDTDNGNYEIPRLV